MPPQPNAELLSLCRELDVPPPKLRGYAMDSRRAEGEGHIPFDAVTIARMVRRSPQTVRRWLSGADPCPSALEALRTKALLKRVREGKAGKADWRKIEEMFKYAG